MIEFLQGYVILNTEAQFGSQGLAAVRLRPLEVDDVDIIVAPSEAETADGVPRNRQRSQLLDQIDAAPSLESDGYAEYEIEAAGRLVGTLQVKAPAHAFPPGVCELGVVVFAPSRGIGIGRGAVALITTQLLDDGWRRVQAATSIHNQAVRHVLEQAGYRLEGVMKAFAPDGDEGREDYELWAATHRS